MRPRDVSAYHSTRTRFSVGTPEAPDSLSLPDALDATERKLAELLAEGPLTLDELTQRSGLDSARTTSTMTLLVLKGVVVHRPGNVFELKRTRPEPNSAK